METARHLARHAGISAGGHAFNAFIFRGPIRECILRIYMETKIYSQPVVAVINCQAGIITKEQMRISFSGDLAYAHHNFIIEKRIK